MEVFYSVLSWGSPVGLAIFFIGLGVFFWGFSQFVKNAPQDNKKS